MMFEGPFTHFKDAFAERCAELYWNRMRRVLTVLEPWSRLPQQVQRPIVNGVFSIWEAPERWLKSTPVDRTKALVILIETRRLFVAVHEALRERHPDIYNFDLPPSPHSEVTAPTPDDTQWARELVKAVNPSVTEIVQMRSTPSSSWS